MHCTFCGGTHHTRHHKYHATNHNFDALARKHGYGFVKEADRSGGFFKKKR